MAKKKNNKKATTPAKQKSTLKRLRHKTLRLPKPNKYLGRPLPSSWRFFTMSAVFLWKNKKIAGGVLAVYGLVQFALVQGVLAGNFTELKNALDTSIGGIGGNVTLLSYMFGSIGQTSSAESSIYQSILFIIGSLAFIWALRQLTAGKSIRIRDAYYRGMYPLIPFILVVLVIGLQTLPILVGAWLYSLVIENGIAVSLVGQFLWLAIFFGFVLVSLYMICSSVFALYIATLPDMTPVKALRSARKLVLHRRWSVARKIILLFVSLFVLAALIMLPLIMVVPVLAPLVFYAGTVIAMGFTHTYIYNIYRELLEE